MRSGGPAPRRVELKGPKHDFWIVPYADMLTLLFAVFVVLYAIGEVRLQKLQELRRSLSSAFRVSQSGYADEGEFDLGPVASGGDLIEGFELINAQPGPMKEFLLETLPERFERITGRSLEIVLLDDTVAFHAGLADFYEPGAVLPREDVQLWLIELFEGARSVASKVRIRIEAPDVVVGRDENGRAVRSDAPCEARLVKLRALLRRIPQVENRFVTTEFRPRPPILDADTWEQQGTISFAFSNL